MTVRSLTHEEARERAELLSVERYDVQVDLSGLLTGPEVRCTSRVVFRCRRPGAETFVDCAADVVGASLNGVDLPGARDGRIPLPDLAEHNTLVVESVQPRTEHGEGVHKAVDPADGETYLWTSFEPDEARFVWACFDQPDLKAPHAFTVTAPERWTVLSNTGGPVVERLETPAGSKVRRWSFAATPPLSTYNPVVLAGPFFEVRREAGGHDLGLFCRQSLRTVLERDAEEILTLTGQGLDFYGRVFGMPFPQRTYNQVFLPEFGGAMENYGCVAWADSFLRRSQPTEAELELLAKVLLHEMAHMWFGNIVTMRWWDDLWLNEAFAELACHWAAVRATRHQDAWASFIVEDELSAYLADQGPTSHPIRQPVRDVAEAASIFDAITYPKGAAVLHQLMAYVGEDRFSAGMTAYFAKHAWGNTTLRDLVHELAEAGGRDLRRWEEAWLDTAGTDRLTLERADGRVALVASAPTGAPRPHLLSVGAYRRTPQGLERVARAEVEVGSALTPVDLPADADLVLPNDEDLTFARVRPGAADRAALLELAPRLPTAVARGVAAVTLWDMLANAEATGAELVAVLAGILRVETSEAVVEPYVRQACDVVDLWSPDEGRADVAAGLASVLRELAERPSSRKVALRGLARVAGSEEEIGWLEDRAGGDTDLLWRAAARRAELVGFDPDRVRPLLENDPDPDAWVRALGVQAAAASADDKAAVWEAVLTRRVPISAVAGVMGGFWRPGQETVLAPYAERFLEALPGLGAGGMMPAMALTNRLFPLFGVDEAYLRQVGAVAATAAPVVHQRALARADEVHRMLRARGLRTGL